MANQLQVEGLQRWQIEQAYCNLLLSQSMAGSALHYNGIKKADLVNQVTGALAARYETADNDLTEILSITAAEVSTQIRLDSITLLELFSIKEDSDDMQVLQNTLISNGLV